MSRSPETSAADLNRRKASSAAGSLVSVLVTLVALLPLTGLLILTARSPVPRNAVPQSLLLFATGGSLGEAMRNSALVAFAVTVSGIGLASIVAYAISRVALRCRGRSVDGIWLASVLPPAVLLLLVALAPLVLLDLLQIYAVDLALYGITAWPCCVWQLQRQYDAIPLSAEEAARLDGCSNAQVFYRLVLRLSAHGLLVTALFSFLVSWPLGGFAQRLLAEWNDGGPATALQFVLLVLSILWPLYAAGWLLRRWNSAAASV
ncbi:MAG: hypothetical protein ACR2ID_10210 [Chthoniobacterales bacterium]